MYNYFRSEKEKVKTIKLSQAKNAQDKHTQLKIQKDKKLLKRYVERTTHGYQKMVEANQDVKQYRNYQHQFRDFNKNLNIGPPSFYFQSRNQKQRIDDALKQNCDLDEVPFFAKENPIRHKFREDKNEGNFKFTSYDTKSRVIQSIQNMKTNEVPNSWNLSIKKYLQGKKKGGHDKSNGSTVKKIILPQLNIKHHPKSLQSIHNKLQIGPLKQALIENKNHSNITQRTQRLTDKFRGKKDSNLAIRYSTIHLSKLPYQENSSFIKTTDLDQDIN